jgi:hypothetical protein
MGGRERQEVRRDGGGGLRSRKQSNLVERRGEGLDVPLHPSMATSSASFGVWYYDARLFLQLEFALVLFEEVAQILRPTQ